MTNESTQTNSTQPVQPAEPITCWVGLDWADKKHCMVVRSAPGAALRQHLVDQKPELLDAWFLQLRQEHPQGRIAVGIEQSRGPVLYALMKFDFLVIYPVNPACLAEYRKAFSSSGAKSDGGDGDLLCEMVCLHPDRLRPLTVEEPTTRQLRLLVEARRDFVDDRTALSNRLGATIKCYYPAALEIVGEDLTTRMALDFLRRWPNWAKLKAAEPATLRNFFYAHNSRSEDRIRQRLECVKEATPLTEDQALTQPLQLQMERLVEQLRTVNKTIERYDVRIKEVFAHHPEAWLFKALPGAGPAMAPRLAATFGTVRSNFSSSNDLLCFSGAAPVTKQSGNMKVVQFRYARPIFCHQTVVEFAKCSIAQCEWACSLYNHHLGKGKSRWAAIRAVAFKWLRILWRCWQDRKAYDETKYLRSLQRDGVQLYQALYQKLPPLQLTRP